MTARLLPVLTCDGRPDGHRCYRAVWLPAGATVRELHAAADGRGWQHRDGRDFCAACAGQHPVVAR